MINKFDAKFDVEIFCKEMQQLVKHPAKIVKPAQSSIIPILLIYGFILIGLPLLTIGVGCVEQNPGTPITPQIIENTSKQVLSYAIDQIKWQHIYQVDNFSKTCSYRGNLGHWTRYFGPPVKYPIYDDGFKDDLSFNEQSCDRWLLRCKTAGICK